VEGLETKVLGMSRNVPIIRECETVIIIDESDYVILDNDAMCTNQATSSAGVDSVKHIYFSIWMKLVEIDKTWREITATNAQQQSNIQSMDEVDELNNIISR
jgi:hypothetical protein